MGQELHQVDVLVVGGGPAGSTVSTFLQRKGRSVLMAEQGQHPRFHIGESLLPMNMPILKELGCFDAVAGIGVVKLGADFTPLGGGSHITFRFARALNRTFPHAFEVKREEFDELLFRHARAEGVDAREGQRVVSATRGNGQWRVELESTSGIRSQVQARYLVDASGRDTFLGNALKLKRRSQHHQSAAIFGHFRGVARRDGPDQGNISIYWFDHGWMWMIPLRDGIMSVGCVCWPEYLKTRQGMPVETFLLATLDRCPEAATRMQGAQCVSEVRVTGNYSYVCRELCGPGWLMVGDAYAFLDPVFSSGVYLAMNSARNGADCVHRILENPARERREQRVFARETRRGLGNFSWFIYRFTTPAMRALFVSPRNTWRVEEAVISMLAGDVFRPSPVLARLRIFKTIYWMSALRNWREHVLGFVFRRRQVKEVFSGGTTSQDHV